MLYLATIWLRSLFLKHQKLFPVRDDRRSECILSYKYVLAQSKSTPEKKAVLIHCFYCNLIIIILLRPLVECWMQWSPIPVDFVFS